MSLQQSAPWTEDDCVIWKRLSELWSPSLFRRAMMRDVYHETDRSDADMMHYSQHNPELLTIASKLWWPPLVMQVRGCQLGSGECRLRLSDGVIVCPGSQRAH